MADKAKYRHSEEDDQDTVFDEDSFKDDSLTPDDTEASKKSDNPIYQAIPAEEVGPLDEGQEISDYAPSQEEISKASDDILSTIPSQAPSRLNQFQDMLGQYAALQNQRRKSDLVAGLAAAGAQIGQSMAGKYSGNFKPDMSGVEILQQQANRPVTDFEQAQTVKGREGQLYSQMSAMDPTSPQSKLIRDYLNKRVFNPNHEEGKDLPEDVSANDAILLLKTVGRPGQTKFQQLPVVNQQTGEKTMAVFNPTLGAFTDVSGKPMGPEWVRDYRAQSFPDPSTGERLGFSGGTGQITGPLTGPGVNRPSIPAAGPGQPPVELDRTLLTAQQAKQVDHTRDKFLQEVKNDRAAINSADRVIQVLTSGQSVGDLPAEVQDQMSRAFGQTGHITDAQMGRALGRSDWKSKLNLAKSMFFEGKIDDKNRQFLVDVMNTIRNQNQQFVTNKAKVYSANLANDFRNASNLKKYNVTPDTVNKLLGVESAAASSQQSQQPPPGTVQVTSKKTGKKFFLQQDKVKEALKRQLIEPLE